MMENMYDYPLVTIVTVCYNVCNDLHKTMQSVIKQTYSNIEYIVVDGGSKDGSVELIKQNIKYISRWISEPDKGIYDAMNKGIEMATGDWIIFMNAGDVFHSDSSVEDVFSMNFPDDVKLIYGDVMLDFGKLGLLPKKFGKIPKESVPFEICHQSVFTKADILKQIHYDLNYRICADCNSFAQIYGMGYKLEYVPVFISRFEVVGGVSSKKIMRAYYEHSDVMGINPYGFKHLPATLRAYIKSVLLKFIPESIYNQKRYNSVKSRDLYN